jgi:type VI protein secretion system component Hcp
MNRLMLRLEDIPGEDAHEGGSGDIALQSMSWSTGRSAGGDFSESCAVTKSTDSTTPRLLALLRSGQPVQAEIVSLGSWPDDDDAEQSELMVITLGDARVTSLSLHASEDGTPYEELEFSYQSMGMSVRPRAVQGATQKPVTFGYEVQPPAPPA